MKRILVALGTCASIVFIFQILHYYECGRVDCKKTDKNLSSDEIIIEHRQKIKNDLENFKFPDGRRLSSYVPELNGSSLQIVIVTTWRSGSTFLGDLIRSIPGMFYYYEPLSFYSAVRVRKPPKSKQAVDNIKSFFRCDYHKLGDYVKFIKSYLYPVLYNKPLWTYCRKDKKFCSDVNFLKGFCGLFPFHSMKVLRLSLKVVEDLLSDENKNLKVIYLVRDPRGTINSRKNKTWCIGDCSVNSLLCDDLVSDYNASALLKSLYPENFRAIRYEDLALHPYRTSESIFNFLGLYVDKNVKKFLDSHTNTNNKNPLSTFRVSRKAPFHWREELNFTEVRDIEKMCSLPMKLWGYVPVKDEISMKYFPPLTDYTLDL